MSDWKDYPSTAAMKAAVELEIANSLGFVQTVSIGLAIQKVIDTVVEDCAKIAEVTAAETGDGEGEIYIARQIADRIRKPIKR